MDKYIGRLLDNRYEILEVIGTGGMAVVYKARCHRLNRLVAIKILKDDYLEDEDFRRRFHAESQAVAMFSHPNIVSVYDVSTSVSLEADYIVMELIDGISLKQYMEKKGVLNWKETLHFAMQIAKALEHAHSRGIVHRDIKPHNIMVLKNGSVKVADFGIARMMSKGNTLTKEALGSVHYISPEQAKGGRVDTRSDIYSLGVVMYEMMTGRPPYDGDSPVSVAIKHIDGGAALPSTINPNIPGGLEQIIMKAMARELDDRYPTASQMLADMDEFRKEPAILFDYNVPAGDMLEQLRRQPLVLQPERTTAQKVANRAERPRRQENNARRRREKEREASRSKASTIAIISCSLVAVIAIVIFLVVLLGGGVLSRPTLVKVPYLVGQMYSTLPQYPGLEIAKFKEVYDDTYEAGVIINQDLAADSEVAEGTKVWVQISLGPAPVEIEMLNLIDMAEDRGKNRLNSLDIDLTITVIQEHNEEIIEGNIIRTSPVEGTTLTAGQEIKLYVSKGPEIKTGIMPNLVGQEKENAELILKNQNLELELVFEEEFDSQAPAGEVLRTIPEKGEDLKTGQKITLYVSKGAELKTLPPLTGSDLDSARKTLFDNGFTKAPEIKYVESDKAEGTVLKQSPEEYTEADVNTVVVLEVSSGPKQQEQAPIHVKIDLRKSADENACTVVVKRDGEEVYNKKVAKGTKSITIKNQVGTGDVYYEVIINQSDGWIEKVTFDAE